MGSGEFIELYIETDSVVIGERPKGGIFRPCQSVIPSSTVEGALRHYFGLKVPAVGFFEKDTYEFDEFTYSVNDKFLNISKIPLTTCYLRPKKSYRKIGVRVYIPNNNTVFPKSELQGAEFQMGALKSKGFGMSKIIKIEVIKSEIKQGLLKAKLSEEEIKVFGIELVSPIYGYLFKPDKFSVGGIYRRALFPDSLVRAPEILLKEVTYYDE